MAKRGATIDGPLVLRSEEAVPISVVHRDGAQVFALSAAGALSALNLTPVEVTATAAGDGTGVVPEQAGFASVVSDNANHIVTLPAPKIGKVVILRNGATGYELRSSAPATVAINGGSGANAESAIAANTMVIAVCTTLTAWQAISLAGTTLAAAAAAAA